MVGTLLPLRGGLWCMWPLCPPYRTGTRLHLLAALLARVFPNEAPLESTRAQGRPGAGRTHGPPATRNAGGSHHRYEPEQPAFPARWVTAYTCSPRGAGFLAPVTRKIIACKLDASVAAPGPHDFAVRNMLLVSQQHRVHRIPPPTSVTIAKRPSDGGGTASNSIYFGKMEVVSCGSLSWDAHPFGFTRQFRFYRSAFLRLWAAAEIDSG